MFFYDSDGKRLKYDIGEHLGGEQYGNVYKTSDIECIKIYKRGQTVDERILLNISELYLKNFYEVHKLLYNKAGIFKAHTMKYYEKCDIDILTMPVEYTLGSLSNLYESVIRLAENYIYACDMHTGNAILANDGVIVIDTDIYAVSQFQSKEELKRRNILALRYLFEQLYLEALSTYHSDICSNKSPRNIRSLFETNGFYPNRQFDINTSYSKLVKYKRPIDYIKNL